MTTLDLDALERAAGNRAQGMVRDFDRWAKMEPKAVAAGSEAQVIYALEDAKTDIAALAQFVRALQERVEGAEKALNIAISRGCDHCAESIRAARHVASSTAGTSTRDIEILRSEFVSRVEGLSVSGPYLGRDDADLLFDEIAVLAARTKAGEPQ